MAFIIDLNKMAESIMIDLTRAIQIKCNTPKLEELRQNVKVSTDELKVHCSEYLVERDKLFSDLNKMKLERASISIGDNTDARNTISDEMDWRLEEYKQFVAKWVSSVADTAIRSDSITNRNISFVMRSLTGILNHASVKETYVADMFNLVSKLSVHSTKLSYK